MTRDGELRATFSTSSQSWSMVTQRASIIGGNNWQYVEVSWHRDKGLYIHIEKRPVELSYTYVSAVIDSPRRNHSSKVYLGSFERQTRRPVAPSYFQVLIDELEIWFADRDHIAAFGFLEDGTCKADGEGVDL